MKKIPIRQIRPVSRELPVSDRFSIRRVQDLLDGKDLMHDLHRHDFFFMLALQKGKGTHEIDFTAYKIIDHSVFFLRPGQVHQLQLKAGSTGYLVEFNHAFYHPSGKASAQRLRRAGNINFCPLEANRFRKIQSVLTYIYQEYHDNQEGYLDIIKANLDILFVELLRQAPVPKGPETKVKPYTQERFEQFSELLDKHLATNKQVSHYAALMNLSPYQLNGITKASLDKTASELINDHIILEAKRYLLATPNQIKEIADHLGYEDVSYFIRFFRKHTGLSPEAFRRNSG